MNKCVIKNVLKQIREDAYRTFVRDIKEHVKNALEITALTVGVIIVSSLIIVGAGFILSRIFDFIPNTKDGVYFSGCTFFILMFVGFGLYVNLYEYISQMIYRAERECKNED